jgi:hypothetical protein
MGEEPRIFKSDDGDQTVSHEPINVGLEVSEVELD